jgi:hypothetical protein
MIYGIQSSPDLLQWTTEEAPAVSILVMEPNGEFWGTGAQAISSPAPSFDPKRYFRLEAR